jgi:hypothetical protein
MRWMTVVPAFALSLLVGCASQVSVDQVPPPNGGGSSGTFAEPRASVQTALSDGPGIAALINKNYNEDTTSCTEYGSGIARGYYFCTGVLMRTTDNGNFNPWESSATALQLRATSYSWIRHDLATRGFFKRAGFIVLNPADILANAVPGLDYLWYADATKTPAVDCVYPFDAWTTRTMDRGRGGCNFEGTGISWPLPERFGSCDTGLGYTTSQQWNSHFRSGGEVNYRQCSWSSDNQQGWRNAIASHREFPAESQWNEVMVANWGGTGSVAAAAEFTRKWVVAFFYDYAKPGSLSDAKAFQQKMANTGKRVPILRIDFNAAASQRFQFLAGDQVAGAYP